MTTTEKSKPANITILNVSPYILRTLRRINLANPTPDKNRFQQL